MCLSPEWRWPGASISLFTAQPEAPAGTQAGASGWAVNGMAAVLAKFSADLLQQSLGRFDAGKFVQHAAFVFDADIATVPGVEYDFHHLLIVGLRFVALRVKIM